MDHCLGLTGGGGDGDSPVPMETDADVEVVDVAMDTSAMETSVISTSSKDRNICFILFRKFIKEVRFF